MINNPWKVSGKLIILLSITLIRRLFLDQEGVIWLWVLQIDLVCNHAGANLVLREDLRLILGNGVRFICLTTVHLNLLLWTLFKTSLNAFKNLGLSVKNLALKVSHSWKTCRFRHYMELCILLALSLCYLDLLIHNLIGKAWEFIPRLFMVDLWAGGQHRALSWGADHHHSILLSHCSVAYICNNVLRRPWSLSAKGLHLDNRAFLGLSPHLLCKLQELLIFH